MALQPPTPSLRLPYRSPRFISSFVSRGARRTLAADLLDRLIERYGAVGSILREPQRTAPRVQGAEAIAPPDQIQHVDERPHQVGNDAGEAHPTRVRHSMCSTDCGHAAFVEILEGRHAGVAVEARPNHLSD